jgi:peptide/nickel transport system substrate-binding protein
LEFRPRLAKSYEISPDGLEFTFVLRDGVIFSDGRPVTGDDVLFSYQTVVTPGIDAAFLANYYINVKQVVKLDDRRVKFVMKEPYFKSLEIAGTLPVIPKHIYAFKDPAEFNRRRSDPVGSGPYIFEKWDVGSQIVLRRNERYWGTGPALNKIVFKIITNDLAALQALRAHEVDLLDSTSEQFVTLSKDKDFLKEFMCLSYWTPMGGYSYIGWNEDTQFFNDKKVRLAMTYMIDRELIRVNIGKGLSKIIAGPFYILGQQNDPNIKPYPFDLEKAKQLLSEAGWNDTDGDGVLDKNGVPFKFRIMSVSGAPIVEQMGKVIKDDAAKIGVVIDLDPYEWSVYLQRLHDRKFEAAFGAWGGVIEEDPYQLFHSSQITGGGSNYVGFRNAAADKLIEEARRTLDESKRNQLYHKFCAILHEEQPYTFMFTRPQLRFLAKRFQDVKIHKIGIDDLEWYVPKELQRYK